MRKKLIKKKKRIDGFQHIYTLACVLDIVTTGGGEYIGGYQIIIQNVKKFWLLSK